jgi:predicted O-methyltransferase YrrM
MSAETISAEVHEYLDAIVPERPAVMREMEDRARETRFPIIGPACGYLCYQYARIVGARRVFELGSGFGYSTAWLAKAVSENGGGEVFHVVWDEELSREARGHLDGMGFGDIVQFRVGEAVGVLQETPGPFDLIFNDIDKEQYPESLDTIAEKLRSGGIMLVDNMLWQGRIFRQDDQDPTTNGVRELTRQVAEDPRWIASVIPIRDGLLAAYKV